MRAHRSTLLIAALVAGCTTTGRKSSDDAQTGGVTSSQPHDGGVDEATAEIARQLQLALPRDGLPADERQRGAAIGYLAQHAEAATPVVIAELERLEALGADPNPVIIVMSALHTPETRRELARVLTTGPAAARIPAAVALSQHAGDDAVAALIGALGAPDSTTIRAGLEGLRIRADRARCVDVGPLLGHANAEVRYTALNTAIALACLDDVRLAQIAGADTDPQVRALAAASRAKK